MWNLKFGAGFSQVQLKILMANHILLKDFRVM
jgi:hypothetical protein